jgi:hypothetical protein
MSLMEHKPPRIGRVTVQVAGTGKGLHDCFCQRIYLNASSVPAMLGSREAAQAWLMGAQRGEFHHGPNRPTEVRKLE